MEADDEEFGFVPDKPEKGFLEQASDISDAMRPKIPIIDTLTSNLFGTEAHDAEVRREHPVVSVVGDVAGTVAVPGAPQMAAAKGAGALTRAGVGAANMASRLGYGAGISAGEALAEGKDAKEAAEDALKAGALIEGGLGLVKGAAGAAKGLSRASSLDNPEYLAALQNARAEQAAFSRDAGPSKGNDILKDWGKAALGGKYGIGKKALRDSLSLVKDKLANSPGSLGKFSGALQEAARRGPQSLLVTHNLLMKTNPEYGAQFQEDDFGFVPDK